MLMAGQSKDDLVTAAAPLTAAGVKIIAIGMGGLFVQSQLSAIATAAPYILTTANFDNLAVIRRKASTLISEGTYDTMVTF